MAETKKDALAAFDVFVESWGVKYDRAVECLVQDREALLAFYDFPAEHWKHLRATNVIESAFATVRHRTVRKGMSLEPRPRWLWSSSSLRPPKKAGAASMVTTSCRKSSSV